MDSGDWIVLAVHVALVLLAVLPFALLRKKTWIVKYPVLLVCLVVASVLYWKFDVWQLELFEQRETGVKLLAADCLEEVDRQIDQKIENLKNLYVSPNTTDAELEQIRGAEVSKLNAFSMVEKEKCIDKYWDSYEFK